MNSTTTKRQRAAVHFCEQWLNITFEGNIEDKYQVSIFLGEYLQDAKNLYTAQYILTVDIIIMVITYLSLPYMIAVMPSYILTKKRHITI